MTPEDTPQITEANRLQADWMPKDHEEGVEKIAILNSIQQVARGPKGRPSRRGLKSVQATRSAKIEWLHVPGQSQDGSDDGVRCAGDGVRDKAKVDSQLRAQQGQDDDKPDEDHHAVALQPCKLPGDHVGK